MRFVSRTSSLGFDCSTPAAGSVVSTLVSGRFEPMGAAMGRRVVKIVVSDGPGDGEGLGDAEIDAEGELEGL